MPYLEECFPDSFKRKRPRRQEQKRNLGLRVLPPVRHCKNVLSENARRKLLVGERPSGRRDREQQTHSRTDLCSEQVARIHVPCRLPEVEVEVRRKRESREAEKQHQAHDEQVPSPRLSPPPLPPVSIGPKTTERTHFDHTIQPTKQTENRIARLLINS